MGNHLDSDVARLLPLMPRDYLILFSLVSEARHGYGIIHQVEEATGETSASILPTCTAS